MNKELAQEVAALMDDPMDRLMEEAPGLMKLLGDAIAKGILIPTSIPPAVHVNVPQGKPAAFHFTINRDNSGKMCSIDVTETL